MEQPVEALALDMVLTPCNSRLHSLHVTYRRLIPAIEVSLHLCGAPHTPHIYPRSRFCLRASMVLDGWTPPQP